MMRNEMVGMIIKQGPHQSLIKCGVDWSDG